MKAVIPRATQASNRLSHLCEGNGVAGAPGHKTGGQARGQRRKHQLVGQQPQPRLQGRAPRICSVHVLGCRFELSVFKLFQQHLTFFMKHTRKNHKYKCCIFFCKILAV